MKKRMWMILSIFFCSVASMGYAYSGGSGTEADPYQIANKADLLELGVTTNDYDKHFVLTDDIDLSGTNFTTAVIAPDADPLTYDFQGVAFSGSFDGAGYSVQNLTISTGEIDGFYFGYLGLFGYLAGPTGSIFNLGIENVSISAYEASEVGGLCGYNTGAISNCYSTGTITGSGWWAQCYQFGGLVGCVKVGEIVECYSTVDLFDGRNIGGLVGNIRTGATVSECYATGDVYSKDASSLGGFSSYNYEGTVMNCYATGSVTGDSRVGGFLAAFSGYGATMENC